MPIECDATGRKSPQQDRSHQLWREANGGAQCGKSARCVRRRGGVAGRGGGGGPPGPPPAPKPSTLLMSGDGKRSVAEWPKLPRPSSTLPFRTCRDVRVESAFGGKADMAVTTAAFLV